MADIDAGVIPDSIEDDPTWWGDMGGNDANDEHAVQLPGETVFQPITLLAPGLAIPVAQKALLLATLLPNGVDRYVGLFASMPTAAGVGGMEASGSGYARVNHTSWVNAIAEHVASRSNNTPVQFDALTGNLSVRGWGIWDAPTGGNLIAFGRLRNTGGVPIIMSLAASDEPRFLPGELVVGIQ